MIIYPAIDILKGRCVRLLQGRFDSGTVYGDNPVEMACKWASMGAKWLHVVDLDGAKDGVSDNRKIIYEIAEKTRVPVQMGGGIRTMEDISNALVSGIERVILGTSAVKNPTLVKDAIRKYPGRIAIGIDATNGRVAIEGWEKVSDFTAVEFAKRMEQLGCRIIIYTDIATDGTLKGPNLKAMEEMIKSVSMDVIASGGVSSIEDLLSLRNIGAAGAITGKAIYTGAFDLKEAISKLS
ncbi:MAG: 1-(5-phosphoribosyl)-5-[(5-phosphoribosylamino)methylideneamino]imidazole-4-carboxamide isomerase [Clostridiaceae bacterium]|jgi:phosphoribosylformimino-5-aminoimidazole carboxamide ribotide isomerase|nr:1-(5-phosphoribosyl)-5-[(5-phosphoribosylamino)methylideneamino]imidazole-4-carboxamide isomerase [Clostridiaceae bacterium]